MSSQRRKITKGMNVCREEKRGKEREKSVGRNLRTEPRNAPTFKGWGNMEDPRLRKGFY